MRHLFLQSVLLVIVLPCFAADQPNILWLVSEDNGQQLGCYGDPYAVTPNLDALAKKSLRYRTCWSNAPVCAAARTTIISGMHATSLGGQHMRSSVGLPADMMLSPAILREAGYYCTNNSKTDYNFKSQAAGWHQSGRKAHYKNRPRQDMPFFSVFNVTISHESHLRSRPHVLIHDPAEVVLPAYHPDTPEVRHDWAQYYDKMTEMDQQMGKLLRQLDEDGLADSTIVFYYGDHGSGMPRSKRWPFDSGLRVPLLVHVPAKYRAMAPRGYSAGGVSEQLVSFVDLAPTVIRLAGALQPANMQGTPFAGSLGFAGNPGFADKPEEEGRKYLFGYRGRMDERIDMVRSVTEGRFVYMRHFYPDRPYLKHIGYMFETPTTSLWKRLFDSGELNEAQAKFWKNKPVEELFDRESDPDEVHNVAGDPQHHAKLVELRSQLKEWMVETRDMGLFPEAEMHRVVAEGSPRAYAMSGEVDFGLLVDVAWAATSGVLDEKEIAKLASHEQGVFRFWAARGGTLQKMTEPLIRLTDDPSPSVAIAACEGLLGSSDRRLVAMASDRLLELANVEYHGHLVAIAALNVIDMRMPMTPSLKVALAQLPRSAKPPQRLGKYVGRLLDHAK